MIFPYKDINPSSRYPVIVILLILANICVFIVELMAGEELQFLIETWGFIPEDFSLINIFTSMFLHGGFFHIFGNMLYLWIFGDNVEDYFGHLKFLIFYFLCGLFASLFQYFLNPLSSVPMIGASGAISGVLGAYFYLYPYARIRSLFFFFIFIERIEVPAGFYLALWFVYQLLGLPYTGEAGIAFGAHIGGFISGFLIAKSSFRKRRKRWARELI